MEAPHSDTEPEEIENSQGLPAWISVLIGVVLVSLAALAAYTGFRYRTRTDERPAVARSAPRAIEQSGAPGEPQAGAARAGSIGDEIPAAQPADQGRMPRVEITGGPGGVVSTVRYTARRGAVFAIEPEDALVSVNNLQIGPANQFSGPDEIYEFPDAGKYEVRITAPGYRDEHIILTADPNSTTEVVRIARRMAAE